MRMPRLLPSLVASLCVVLAGCASSGSGGMDEPEPSGDGIAVEVNNDLVPPASVTVYIVPETGSRRRLGSVPPGGRGTFSYDPPVPSMDYRLVAEAPGTQDHRTNPFVLTGVTRVQWNVSNPNARISRAP